MPLPFQTDIDLPLEELLDFVMHSYDKDNKYNAYIRTHIICTNGNILVSPDFQNN